MDKVNWFEIPADDTGRAGTFYSSVFGWNVSDMGNGSLYAMTTQSDDQTNPLERGVINGDISPRSEKFKHPLIVITVEDLDAKLKMVAEAGGTVVEPRQDYPDMGIAWALVADTEGNVMGVTQNI